MTGPQIILTLLGGLGVVVVGASILAIGLQARRCKIPFWKPIMYSAGAYCMAFFIKPPATLIDAVGWKPVETMDSVRIILLALVLAFTARSIIEDHKGRR